MLSKPAPRVLFPLVCLGLLTPIASALTLGRVEGAAVLGRPPDLRVAVTLDAGMALDDLCPQVDLLYGDNRVDPRRVEVQAAGQGEQALLRVRSAVPLDEPFLTLMVQVGCTQRLGRRYVLLPEQPVEPLGAPAAAAPLPTVELTAMALAAGERIPAATAGGPPGLSPAGTQPPVSAMTAGVVVPAVKPDPAERPVRPARAVVPTAPAVPPPAPPGPASRLRLEAIDGPVPPAPRAAGAPPSMPPGSLPPVSTALVPASPVLAGALQAEALLATPERMQVLEMELKGLRESITRSQSSMAELRSRVDQAERARYANPLVYALIILLAAALALAAWLWRRAQSDGPLPREHWWAEPEGPASPPPRAPAPLQPSSLITTGRAPATAGPDLLAGGAAMLRGSAPEGRPADPANLSSNELSDVQQAADFFVSLGEYDRAIDVLRNHIELHPQSSAVAWLELLDIHHKLGRRDDYERLRHDFEWLFNARMPTFDAFDADQNGLEDHPALLRRIQDLWPSAEVLEVIDAAVFRAPAEGGEVAPLGLRACRELLFLYKLASDMQLATPGPHARDWLSTPGDPISAALPAARALALAPSLGGRPLDVDLDDVLAQPASAGDAAASVPTGAEGRNGPLGEGGLAGWDGAPRVFDERLDRLLDFDLDPKATPGDKR